MELTREDSLPLSLVDSPSSFRAGVPLSSLVETIPPAWTDAFHHIEEEGTATSLAQVHRARLRDGRNVAVKIQVPEISRILRLDLWALARLMPPMGAVGKGWNGWSSNFNGAECRNEIRRLLFQELDYTREADMLRRFSFWTDGWDSVVVPQVVDELSSERVLTMTWVEGETLAQVRRWPMRERWEIARSLLRLFLISCFHSRILHTDPHPGNYRFLREEGRTRVALFDFGSAQMLSSQFVDPLRELLQDVVAGRIREKKDQVFDRYVRMGFEASRLAPMARLLTPLTQTVFIPFCQEEPFRVESWNLGERIGQVLGDYRWNFRRTAPPELLSFVRAFQGLLQYLKVLDAPLCWREVLEETWNEPNWLRPWETSSPADERTTESVPVPAASRRKVTGSVPPASGWAAPSGSSARKVQWTASSGTASSAFPSSPGRKKTGLSASEKGWTSK
ncbi:MAG: AarF/UbiB family protein [Acidobacteria bacterium]|nr:AarF/UbiB family protein [Acidobacteriota bacterium]